MVNKHSFNVLCSLFPNRLELLKEHRHGNHLTEVGKDKKLPRTILDFKVRFGTLFLWINNVKGHEDIFRF